MKISKFIGMVSLCLVLASCNTISKTEPTNPGGSEPTISDSGSSFKQATVTFIANGGHFANDESKMIKQIQIETTIGSVEEPSLESFTFDGWYTSLQGGYEWNLTSDVVYTDMTLYAHWFDDSINYFTITFDADDGVFEDGESIKQVRVKNGERIPVPEEPSKEDYTFQYWGLFSGMFDVQYFKYENGEEVLDETYLYRDEGYYTPKSNLTFKAYWQSDIRPINIWHSLGSAARENGDLENTINDVASNMGIEVNVAYQAYGIDGFYSSLYATIPAGNSPEVFLLYNYDSIENVDDLGFDYNPFGVFEDFSDFFMPLKNTQNHDYVINNFDESIYQYVYDSSKDEVFGFPLYSYQTLLRSKENKFEIPAAVRVYGFINKYSFDNPYFLGHQNKEKMLTMSENLLKELSKKYLDK